MDDEGNDRGKSQIIGKKAVVQTAFTRMILTFCTLITPTIVFYALERKKMIPKNKLGKLFLDITVIFFSLRFSVPISVALFP